ncbi:MAG: rhodanese-like domain-containing protein [Deltaproteobacteria bacterium]
MSVAEITVAALAELLGRPPGERPFLLDVRNPDEHDFARLPGATLIPLPELPERWDEVPLGRDIVVYCHHGIRSLSGAAILAAQGRAAKSLRGGIDAWSQAIDPSVPRY